jgi:plasmid stability protein
MGQVLVRNLEDSVIAGLKLRAELKGKSLEQELRDLLTAAAPMSVEERVAVSERLRRAFAVEEFDTGAAIRWGRDDEFHELEFKDEVS